MEACWAHNPKVGGSNPPSATFLAGSSPGGGAFLVNAFTVLHNKRSGAAGARWAHNPKVGGSKPPSASFVLGKGIDINHHQGKIQN